MGRVIRCWEPDCPGDGEYRLRFLPTGNQYWFCYDCMRQMRRDEASKEHFRVAETRGHGASVDDFEPHIPALAEEE